MPKYYAFLVKKDIKNLYSDREIELYILLKKLYSSNNNMVLKISLFNQLCELIDRKKLKSYLDKKVNIKNNKSKYMFSFDGVLEKTLIEINRSSLVIISNLYNPVIFKVLKYMYNDLFICDFDNNKYFFIHK